MLSLFIVACSIDLPGECKDFKLSFANNISPLTCTVYAQPELAKWAESHKNWYIKRWACRYEKNSN